MNDKPNAAERRKQSRYNVGGVPIRLWISHDHKIDALMIDASYQGAALIAPVNKVGLLKVGDELRVVRNELEQAATIRSISRYGKGQCRVAITWGHCSL